MRTTSQLDRRSFLLRVLGAGIVGLAAPAAGRQQPRRMEVDADPRDPAREIPLAGRRGRIGTLRSRPGGPAGEVDRDSGASSDATGAGRATGRFVICPGSRRCRR
jgi:hypothetical protein